MTSIYVSELAEILTSKGYLTSQNKLFQFLREHDYLNSAKGKDHNLPTEKSKELGLFEIEKSYIMMNNRGGKKPIDTPKVTPTGMDYFIRLLVKDTTND